ncbi:TonB-dependent receptor domain-containing protein [Sphingomonas sp. MMS24-JH45]
MALTYNIAPDVHVYGRYATGYQSGGIIRQVAFRPEDYKSAEVGIKSEFLDRKVRLNATYFHTNITDQQRAGGDSSRRVLSSRTSAT